MCAIIQGDLALWNLAKEQIKTAHCHDQRDRYAVVFWLAAVESEIRETNTFPLWFTRGALMCCPVIHFPLQDSTICVFCI